MATPITWRNINAPSFSSAALGVASDSFSRAQRGFQDLSDFAVEREGREDDLLTNDAISTALAGGPISTNRRVDAERLRASLDARNINDSNLETAESTRLTQAQGREKGALDIDNKTVVNEHQLENIQADLLNKQNRAEADLRSGNLSQLKYDRLVKNYAREDKNIAGVKQIQDVAQGYFDQAMTENWSPELQEQFREQLAAPREAEIVQLEEARNHTPKEIDAFRAAAAQQVNEGMTERERQVRAIARSQSTQEVGARLPELLRSTGTSSGFFEANSVIGAELGVARAAGATEAAARLSRQKDVEKFTDNEAVRAASGDVNGWVYDNGDFRPTTSKAERAGNTLNQGQLRSHLTNTYGIPKDNIDKDKLTDLRNAASGNKSIIDEIFEQGSATTAVGKWNPFRANTNRVEWQTVLDDAKTLATAAQEAAGRYQRQGPGADFSNTNTQDLLARGATSEANRDFVRTGADDTDPVTRALTNPTSAGEVLPTVARLKTNLTNARASLNDISDAAQARNPRIVAKMRKALSFVADKPKEVIFEAESVGPTGRLGETRKLDPEERVQELRVFEDLRQQLLANEREYQAKQQKNSTDAATAEALKSLSGI